MSPYWGNYAALGLANAGGSVKIKMSKDWLEWYKKKVKSSGVMSKYELEPPGN